MDSSVDITTSKFLKDFTRLFTMAASYANEKFTYALAQIAEHAEREPGLIFMRGQEAGLWDTFLNCILDESVPRYRMLDLLILKIMFQIREKLNDYSERDESAKELKTKLMNTFPILYKHHMATDSLLILQCFNTFRVEFGCSFPKSSVSLLRSSMIKINGDIQVGKESFCLQLNIVAILVEESSEEAEYKINCQVIQKGLDIFSGVNLRTVPMLVPFILEDLYIFGYNSRVFKSNGNLAQRSMELYLGIIQNEYRSSLKERTAAVKSLELCWSALDSLEYFYSLEVLPTPFSIAKYQDGWEAILWIGQRTMNLSRSKRSAHIANIEGVKMECLEKLIRLAVISCRNDSEAATKLLSSNLVMVALDMLYEMRFDSFIHELMGYILLSDVKRSLQFYVIEILRSMTRTADEYLSYPGVLCNVNIDSFIVLLSILAHYSPSSLSKWTDMDCALCKMLAHGFTSADSRIYVIHALGNVCWEQESTFAIVRNRECLEFYDTLLAAPPPYEAGLNRMKYQVGYLQVLHNLQKFAGSLYTILRRDIIMQQVKIAATEAIGARCSGEHCDTAIDMMRLVLCVMIKYCRRKDDGVFAAHDMHKILLNCVMVFLEDDQIVELGLWVMYLMCKNDKVEMEKYTRQEKSTVGKVMHLVHRKWPDPKIRKRIKPFATLLRDVGGLYIIV